MNYNSTARRATDKHLYNGLADTTFTPRKCVDLDLLAQYITLRSPRTLVIRQMGIASREITLIFE